MNFQIMIRPFLLILLVSIAAGTSPASSMNSLSPSSSISCLDLHLRDRAAAIRRVATAGFPVVHMVGKIEGRTINLYVLGETHILTDAQVQATLDMQSIFRVQAQEGANKDAYWFPRLMQKFFDRIRKFTEAEMERSGLNDSSMQIAQNRELRKFALSALKFSLAQAPKDSRSALLESVLNSRVFMEEVSDEITVERFLLRSDIAKLRSYASSIADHEEEGLHGKSESCCHRLRDQLLLQCRRTTA